MIKLINFSLWDDSECLLCVIFVWALYKNCFCKAMFTGILTIHSFCNFNRQKYWNSMKKQYILTSVLKFEFTIILAPVWWRFLCMQHMSKFLLIMNTWGQTSFFVFTYAHICHRFSVNPSPSNPVWEQSQLCHYLSDFLGTTHVVFTRFVTDSLVFTLFNFL